MGRRRFNLTERNIHYALYYNCNTNRALASGLYRPLWRRSDSSSARDCRYCARYSAPSRQTALSESVFVAVVSVGRESSRSASSSICGYQFVTCFRQTVQKEDLKPPIIYFEQPRKPKPLSK